MDFITNVGHLFSFTPTSAALFCPLDRIPLDAKLLHLSKVGIPHGQVRALRGAERYQHHKHSLLFWRDDQSAFSVQGKPRKARRTPILSLVVEMPK
jgi:hypothetical protein